MTTPREDTPYDCSPWAQYDFVDGIIAVIDFELLERLRSLTR